MTLANMSASSVDPLLPGEDRQSDMLDDADHWVAVYEELLSFLVDVRECDCDKIGTFRSRLDYWRQRRDELAH